MSIESIISALPKTPVRFEPEIAVEDFANFRLNGQITNYDSARGDTTGLGWVRPGDPRSELVLSLFKEGIGLPLLLNGLPRLGTPQSEWFKPPASELVSAISPLAQLRRGAYDVPTFIIHGTNDQIAPFTDAERFVAELKRQGIVHGFLPLTGIEHIHDLTARPGSKEWKEMVEPGYRFLFEIVGNQ
jgi:acetyl esterase/lipase